MTSTGKRLALVAACNQYADPSLTRLSAPGRDVHGLKRILKRDDVGNFRIRACLDRKAQFLQRAIEVVCKEVVKDDLLLLYFSGHGLKDDDGQLYLATRDTDPKLLRTTAVPADFLNDCLNHCEARQQVLILDCCFSGAVGRSFTPKGKSDEPLAGKLFEPPAAGRGRFILTASGRVQYAYEGKAGDLSLFTRHLVRGLETGEADRDRDGWVALDELYAYIHEHVLQEHDAQTPFRWVYESAGQIYLARSTRPQSESDTTLDRLDVTVGRRAKGPTSPKTVPWHKLRTTNACLEYLISKVHAGDKTDQVRAVLVSFFIHYAANRSAFVRDCPKCERTDTLRTLNSALSLIEKAYADLMEEYQPIKDSLNKLGKLFEKHDGRVES